PAAAECRKSAAAEVDGTREATEQVVVLGRVERHRRKRGPRAKVAPCPLRRPVGTKLHDAEVPSIAVLGTDPEIVSRKASVEGEYDVGPSGADPRVVVGGEVGEVPAAPEMVAGSIEPRDEDTTR